MAGGCGVSIVKVEAKQVSVIRVVTRVDPADYNMTDDDQAVECSYFTLDGEQICSNGHVRVDKP